MNVQPWAWRLYADTAPSRLVRFVFKSLRWGASIPRWFRLVNLGALAIGAFYLLRTYWNDWPTLSSTWTLALGGGATFLMIRGALAQLAAYRFPGDSLPAGLPLERRVDLLVPPTAKRVALVGQNLATPLGSGYGLMRSTLKSILNRQSIKEVWLVLQTPLALTATHPIAAEHLEQISVAGLNNRAKDLGADADRVFVAFHPAATLSMTTWDWGDTNAQRAIIIPKMQSTERMNDRLSVIVEGASFGASVGEFERFLSDAEKGDFPGASIATLRDAATVLKALLAEPIVALVRQHLQAQARKGQVASPTP